MDTELATDVYIPHAIQIPKLLRETLYVYICPNMLNPAPLFFYPRAGPPSWLILSFPSFILLLIFH